MTVPAVNPVWRRQAATGQHAGPRSDAERFAGDATVRAREAIVPAGLFQIRCTGRVIGKKSLELRERFRERKLRAVENIHVEPSGFRTQSIPSGCLRQADRHGSMFLPHGRKTLLLAS